MKPSQATLGASHPPSASQRGCSVGRGPRELPGGGDPIYEAALEAQTQPPCSAAALFASVFLQPAGQAKVALTATGQRVGWGHEVGDRPRTPPVRWDPHGSQS